MQRLWKIVWNDSNLKFEHFPLEALNDYLKIFFEDIVHKNNFYKM